jgi:hypothetical protein
MGKMLRSLVLLPSTNWRVLVAYVIFLVSYDREIFFDYADLVGVENGRRRKSRVAENVEKPDFGFIILDIQWLVFLASSIIQSENKKYLKGMQPR